MGLQRIALRVVRNGLEDARTARRPVTMTNSATTTTPLIGIDFGRFYSDKPAKAPARSNPKPGEKTEKITLNGTDGSISITSLEEAQKIAKRRGLKLVKEMELDGKSQRPVYRYYYQLR